MVMRLIGLMLLVMCSLVEARQLLKDPTRPANRIIEVTDAEGDIVTDGQAAEGGALGQSSQSGFPSVKLSAIVVTEPMKYAIINNEVVFEGQPWRNVILSKVKPYSIIITLNDLEKEITISKTDFIAESNYEN